MNIDVKIVHPQYQMITVIIRLINMQMIQNPQPGFGDSYHCQSMAKTEMYPGKKSAFYMFCQCSLMVIWLMLLPAYIDIRAAFDFGTFLILSVGLPPPNVLTTLNPYTHPLTTWSE